MRIGSGITSCSLGSWLENAKSTTAVVPSGVRPGKGSPPSVEGRRRLRPAGRSGSELASKATAARSAVRGRARLRRRSLSGGAGKHLERLDLRASPHVVRGHGASRVLGRLAARASPRRCASRRASPRRCSWPCAYAARAAARFTCTAISCRLRRVVLHDEVEPELGLDGARRRLAGLERVGRRPERSDEAVGLVADVAALGRAPGVVRRLARDLGERLACADARGRPRELCERDRLLGVGGAVRRLHEDVADVACRGRVVLETLLEQRVDVLLVLLRPGVDLRRRSPGRRPSARPRTP